MLSRKVTNNENVAGVCFVCKFENVWELVTAPSDSLSTRQNGVKNRDKAYFMFTQTSLSSIVWEKLTKKFYSEVLRTYCRENDAFPVPYMFCTLRAKSKQLKTRVKYYARLRVLRHSTDSLK